jgi:NAD(P)-dependent dehydrogenase (short-subunit alcohol dehydrogenase family)
VVLLRAERLRRRQRVRIRTTEDVVIGQGRLAGKVALVTGGGTGIGEAICKKFALEGAQVAVNGLEDDPIEDVARDIVTQGGSAFALPGDVSIDIEAREVVERTIAHYGRLDVLVNNAGVLLTHAATDHVPVEQFDTHVRNNIRSAFLMTKYALPHLKETRGNILCAGSEAGMRGLPYDTPYGGTKGFMHAFALGVAAEQAKFGVRVNCVCPGPIDTAMTRKGKGPMDGKQEKATVEGTPLGRRGTPEEVANVYAFLASDEASFVTGALWLVDGGSLMARGLVGKEAEREVRTPPAGDLDLRHAHDGMRNKSTVKIKQ